MESRSNSLSERNENRLSPEALTTFEGANAPMAKEFTINLHGETYNIKIEGSGAKDENVRPFFVRVNGDLKEVLVESSEKDSSKVPSKNPILCLKQACRGILFRQCQEI